MGQTSVTRTLDKNTRAGIPDSVVSRMIGPPQETTQDKDIDKGHTPRHRIEIEIIDSVGIRTQFIRLEGRNSTDQATTKKINYA